MACSIDKSNQSDRASDLIAVLSSWRPQTLLIDEYCSSATDHESKLKLRVYVTVFNRCEPMCGRPQAVNKTRSFRSQLSFPTPNNTTTPTTVIHPLIHLFPIITTPSIKGACQQSKLSNAFSEFSPSSAAPPATTATAPPTAAPLVHDVPARGSRATAAFGLPSSLIKLIISTHR